VGYYKNKFNYAGLFYDFTYSTNDSLLLKIRNIGTDKVGLQWGEGITYDVNLYRSAANILKTDDIFDCYSLKIGGTEIISSGRILSSCTYEGTVIDKAYIDSDIARDTELVDTTESDNTPSGGKDGDMWYNSVSEGVYIKIAGTWRHIS
jgi:hypothetical protein